MNRYTETERQHMVRAFEGSGESATAFCRRQGVSTVSLAQWRKRYARRQSVSVPAAASSWVPVVITDAGAPAMAAGRLCYRMACGDFRLEVPAGFAPDEVRQLWELLAGAMRGGPC
jgi:transposase-like protein